ncbi:LysR family transcriptional regulator [Micromonospora sp. NPDC050200]|uniref:LysR family transcriptional regulator n=1 Tax=Micromonospora sp. NPDC050200 TaxID=3155664 RepID=UPI003407E52A
MLDPRRLHLLRTVVTTGSVSAAARDLGFTPSAVSQQLGLLEKEAGITLLERNGRGVRPTEAGRLLSRYAEAIDAQVAAAEAALADLRAGVTGRLAVRYFASVGAALVAPALATLRRDHPGVRVDLKLTDPADPLREVRDGNGDLALVVRPREQAATDGLRFTHLRDDPYLALLPAGHRLGGRRALDLADLAADPWVGSEQPGPCQDAILVACGRAGFTPRFVVQSEDYATAQGFVAAGLGIALVPRLGLPARSPGVVVRRIHEPEPVRTIWAATRGTAPATPALTGLLAALRTAGR